MVVSRPTYYKNTVTPDRGKTERGQKPFMIYNRQSDLNYPLGLAF